ncbi:MAG TPA: lysozyme inhibitor LprI family protein [Acidimicrobiales bacterium]|jgi:uncharacterized protein YecT (DUF1311 family)|nr:lysozyme inhibitor LprI family protein [Acidimicrobiales bacterium]
MKHPYLLIAVTSLALFAGASPVSASGAPSVLKAPVVNEKFTLLPCSQASTIGMEGCAEAQTLVIDRQINGLAKTIFGRLPGRADQLRFIKSEKAWLSYRRASCASRSDTYAGGSEASVVFAQCLVALGQLQATNLGQFVATFPGGNEPPS